MVEAHHSVPVNMRPRDAPMIEAAKEIAQRENKQMTTIFREALAEYVERRKILSGGTKLEQFMSGSPSDNPSLDKVLVPSDLKGWSEPDLLTFARKVRARAQELSLEMRKRKIIFQW